MRPFKIQAGVLEISGFEYGDPEGWPCILSHGFPYSPDCYAEAAPILAAAGARVVVPFLRGYGPTRFLSADTPRSGEQAALGADLLALMGAMGIERAVLGGYDWGGRASCIVAALWPERCQALVSGNSWNIQIIAKAMEPADPATEASLWYQYYFHSERGRRGLERDRRAVARQLWRMWSPTWDFDAATFDRSASAWDNPDYVDVVIHSYRHRFGLVPGDPGVARVEALLAQAPRIGVPCVTIDGSVDGVDSGTAGHAPHFSGLREHRVFENAGHNLPQERPADWAQAVLDARAMALAAGRD